DKDEARARVAEDALADILAADASFVLDRLAEWNAGKLDLRRAAIVGHSRGGITVARGCSKEPRFVACVTMDNIGPEREAAEGLHKPQLTIRTSGWSPERVQRLHAFLSRNTAGATEAVVT